MSQLRDLNGLGPKLEQLLIEVAINTEQDLRAIGAIHAFIRLKRKGNTKPSLNFVTQ